MKINIKKTLLTFLFAGVVILLFHTEIRNAMIHIKQIPFYVLIILAFISLLVQFIEGLNIKEIVKANDYSLTHLQAFKVALSIAFIRGVTLGSATFVGTIYYLNDYNVDMGEATSVSLVNYIYQQIAFSLMGILAFLLLMQDYISYARYILVACLLSACLCISLIIVASSKSFQTSIDLFFSILDRKNKFISKREKLNSSLQIFREASINTLQSRHISTKIILQHILRLVIQYVIPFVVLNTYTSLSIYDCITRMSLLHVMASVFPSPSGIGTTEYLFTRLFQGIAIFDRLLSCALVYRIFTFIFPAICGGIYRLFHIIRKLTI